MEGEALSTNFLSPDARETAVSYFSSERKYLILRNPPKTYALPDMVIVMQGVSVFPHLKWSVGRDHEHLSEKEKRGAKFPARFRALSGK